MVSPTRTKLALACYVVTLAGDVSYCHSWDLNFEWGAVSSRDFNRKQSSDWPGHEDDSDTCPVCLDPFDEIEDRFLCKMRCGHKICEKCFLVLRSPKRCPTCHKEHPGGPIYLK